MKEFDKIYIAKYDEILSDWQIGRDLEVKTDKVCTIKEELKENGLYKLYRNMPDDEWDTLSNKTDEQIIKTYLPRTQNFYERIFNKVKKVFEPKELAIYKFKIYKPKENIFKFDYFNENNFKDEEWKKIGPLNYEISNYGRIKNIQTKKLKQLKFQKYGMQVILWNNSKSYTITISRLVAEMFIKKLEKDERVFHRNGDIRDNYYKNLKIVKMNKGG